VAIVGFVAGTYAPIAYYRSRRRATRRVRQQCWPEAIELLAGAVRAGDTLPAAVALVAERGPEPLRPTFRAVVADHRISGDFVGALERLGAALADPTADRVVATLVIAHRVGGRELGRVLRTLSGFLREDLAVRKEIVARQSWTLVAARVAAAAPWLVLVLVASRPQGARAYDSLAGLLVLAGGAAATVVGYRLMVALGRLPEEPRVLAGATAGIAVESR
jgi:tight adherence protein B